MSYAKCSRKYNLLTNGLKNQWLVLSIAALMVWNESRAVGQMFSVTTFNPR